MTESLPDPSPRDAAARTMGAEMPELLPAGQTLREEDFLAEDGSAREEVTFATIEPETAALSSPGAEPTSVTEFLPETEGFSFDQLPPCPRFLKHPLRAIGWCVSLAFGFVSLIIVLAIIAAIPLVNFLALGFLLEAEGRVARTGKFRYAVPLLALAPRLGSILLGCWGWLLIVRLVADAATDAATIAPGSNVAAGWELALNVVSIGVAGHMILALARGGGPGTFVRPIKNLRWVFEQLATGRYWATAGQAIGEFVAALRLWHHFRLGFLGFLGTFLWLILPTALFAALRDVNQPGQILLTLLGACVLMPVLAWAPFLQAHYACEQRFGAFKELGRVRRLFNHAPLSWLVVTILLYALALPLYLFKIVAPPQDAMWFITLIFITTIYPAKVLIGWAYAQARLRDRRAWFLLRWPCRLVLAPLLFAYLFFVFFTPAIGAAGRRVLFEHHALLLPTPF